MIEIVMDKERNLKNVKQIGTPREEDKIYVENLAYSKMREESYKDKKVFVLMGHSEYSQGRYATFVEAAIPVKDVEFVGNVPRWNNAMWSEVFREVRRLYEDMIIVGWAIDIKGMPPKMTMELERVHREHFGGVHQVLFLLNSIEYEESFYVYKENRLVSKDGFYIYYRAHKKINMEKALEVFEEERAPKLVRLKEVPQNIASGVQVDLEMPQESFSRGGKYRQIMQEQGRNEKIDSGNVGLAIAAAMLIFVIGVGIYESRDTWFGEPQAVETNVIPQMSNTEENNTENATEVMIPVEIIEGTESTEDAEE